MVSIRPFDERRDTRGSTPDAEPVAIRRYDAAPAQKGMNGIA